MISLVGPSIQDVRLQHARYHLEGEICTDCHKYIFPPRDLCPYCQAILSPKLEEFLACAIHDTCDNIP